MVLQKYWLRSQILKKRRQIISISLRDLMKCATLLLYNCKGSNWVIPNNMSFCCFWDHKPRSSWSSQVPGFKALTIDLLPQSENVWDCIENLFEARSREEKKKESALGVESRCCGGVHRRGKLACNHSILKVYRLGGHKIHCISLFTRRYRGGVPAVGRVGGGIWFSMENMFPHMYVIRICIGGWGMCI